MFLLGGCAGAPWIKNIQFVNEKGSVIWGLQNIDIESQESRLPDYEKITYEVKWLGLPVGTLTTSIIGIKNFNGRDAYVLEATMKSNAFISRIYKIEDRFVSYMDVEKLYTLRHEVYRRDGSYKKDAITEFDQENHKAHFKNFIDKSEKTFDIPEGVHDVLSAYYYFRLLPIKVGGKADYHVCNNESNYQFFSLVKQKVLMRLPNSGAKEEKAFLMQPYALFKGEQVKKANVKAYFSLEKKRIPLLVILKGPIFTEVTISLIKIEEKQASPGI